MERPPEQTRRVSSSLLLMTLSAGLAFSQRANRVQMTRQVYRTRMGPWLIDGVLACVALAGAGVSGCGHTALLPLGTNNETRMVSPAAADRWAEPMEVAGLPNLHRVSDDLYRGAQPTAEGIEQLEKMGIKTVVNLRSSDSERGMVDHANLVYEHIPMTAWRPSDQDVVQFLRIVGGQENTPIFVHCRRGADRTGMACAIYRVAVQGWSKEDAIAEMTRGGFDFYSGWQNLVRYIRDLDIDALKQRAGLSPGN